MSEKSKFTAQIAFITDDPSQGVDVLRKTNVVAATELYVWDQVSHGQVNEADIIIFDIDTGIAANIDRIKAIKASLREDQKVVFATDKTNRRATLKIKAMGARDIVERPIVTNELIPILTEICLVNFAEDDQVERLAALGRLAANASLSISDLMDSFTLVAKMGGKLPIDDLNSSSSQVNQVFQESGMDEWLKTVRLHSSYTYRHVMLVTGFAAAFGLTLGFSEKDKERLTMGALIHDIGKVKVSIKILDKPGKLNARELEQMRRHTIEGAQILRRDSYFDDEMISVAHHHHEFLDGSGYPDQLKSEEIPDIVRIMTVIDIYSALVEARSYKESMPVDKAYDILIEMGEKLDQGIVRAFEPVAIEHGTIV